MKIKRMEQIGTREVALQKLQKYCAYQDRCHAEVRNKLFELKVYGELQEEVIAALVAEGFLNEERFAANFARGKLRMNHWGRVKIKMALKQKQVSDYSIQKAMQALDEGEYKDVLELRLQKLKAQYGDASSYAVRQKIVQSLLRNGFEMELIREALSLEE